MIRESNIMLISDLLHEGQQKLQNAGIAGFELDSILLLGHCLNMSRTEVYLRSAELADEACCQRYSECIQRRISHEPVAYILQEREFWSLDFEVNNHVLIPRPETEFLLETVFRYLKKTSVKVLSCIDLCCGSGIIAVVLARELGARVLAVDCSSKALAVARRNVMKHNVDDLVQMVCSDLFASVSKGKVYPLIVSNPPYVSRGAIENDLEAEVADYEPQIALDGGQDGLDCIRRIAGEVVSYLSPSGLFFLEFGAEQGEAVENIFLNIQCDGRYFEKVTILQDYSGRDRVLAAQLNAYA